MAEQLVDGSGDDLVPASISKGYLFILLGPLFVDLASNDIEGNVVICGFD